MCLVNGYELSELPHLTEEDLARGSEIEEQLQKFTEVEQLQQSLFNELGLDNIGGGDEHDRGSGLQCSRCHSHNIALEQKQTRGADESMTIFCECRNCNKRWKM